MAKQRKLQIDVKGPTDEDPTIIECILSVDGRDCLFYMSEANYRALLYDGIFVRDGNETDSANCVNTTSVYVEMIS